MRIVIKDNKPLEDIVEIDLRKGGHSTVNLVGRSQRGGEWLIASFVDNEFEPNSVGCKALGIKISKKFWKDTDEV